MRIEESLSTYEVEAEKGWQRRAKNQKTLGGSKDGPEQVIFKRNAVRQSVFIDIRFDIFQWVYEYPDCCTKRQSKRS